MKTLLIILLYFLLAGFSVLLLSLVALACEAKWLIEKVPDDQEDEF